MKLLTEGDRTKWLATRRLGLGSSDAPVLVGASRKSLLALYAEKTGLVADDTEETELMEAGLELQPGIGRMFSRKTKRTLLDVAPWSVYQSEETPFMLASPDFFCEPVDGHATPGGAEVKFVTFAQGDDWEEEPPLAAQVQVQQQMYVCHREWWSVVGLVRGRMKYADVDRDDRFLKALLELARDFMRRVELRDPPAPDASESAKQVLAELFPQEAPGKVIPLPPDAMLWDAQYLEADEAEKAAHARKAEAQNQLRAFLGDAERGMLLGGATWTNKLKSVKAEEKLRAAYSYRDLRRQKGK